MKGENVAAGGVVELLQKLPCTGPQLIVGGATPDWFYHRPSLVRLGRQPRTKRPSPAYTSMPAGVRCRRLVSPSARRPDVCSVTEHMVERTVVGDPTKPHLVHRFGEMLCRFGVPANVQVVMWSGFIPEQGVHSPTTVKPHSYRSARHRRNKSATSRASISVIVVPLQAAAAPTARRHRTVNPRRVRRLQCLGRLESCREIQPGSQVPRPRGWIAATPRPLGRWSILRQERAPDDRRGIGVIEGAVGSCSSGSSPASSLRTRSPGWHSNHLASHASVSTGVQRLSSTLTLLPVRDWGAGVARRSE